MERTQVQRRHQHKRKEKVMKAWAFILLTELLVSAIPAGIAAAFLVPLAKEIRGYTAVGGEWLLIAVIFCGTYCVLHKWVCDKVFEEGKRE